MRIPTSMKNVSTSIIIKLRQIKNHYISCYEKMQKNNYEINTYYFLRNQNYLLFIGII